MSTTKVAVSMDKTLLLRLDKLVRTHPFRSRSQVIQEAVAEKVDRMDKSELARECAKLDRKFEQSLADEGLAAEGISHRLRPRGEPTLPNWTERF
jgi:Arc/MetJ-type ribon-helix-helix transcriptional regulator